LGRQGAVRRLASCEQGCLHLRGAISLEVEAYLADRIALTVNLRERCLWGGSTGHFHTQYGIGLKFIIN